MSSHSAAADGPRPMTFLSLFAGVGGFDLALTRLRVRCVDQVELDPAAQRVLTRHLPEAARHDEIHTTIAWWQATPRPRVDLICAGWPCQDLSQAGRRAGLAGPRSGLFFALARVVDALHPSWLLRENVPGMLTCNQGTDFQSILATLVELGYGLAWRVLDARYFLRTSGGSAGGKAEAGELARASRRVDLRCWAPLCNDSGVTATVRIEPCWPSSRCILADPSEIRSIEACAAQIGTAKVTIAEARLAQVSIAEIRLPQTRPDKARLSKVRAAEIRLIKPGLSQVSSHQEPAPNVGLAEVYVCQTTVLKMNLAHFGTREIRERKRGTGKPAFRKIRAAQIDSGQVCCLVISGWNAATEHDYADRNVRGAISQPGKLLVDCRVRVRPSALWRDCRPGGVGAHEDFQDPGDRFAVHLGIPGDTLQRKDAAEPDVELVAAKLVDGPCETLGDLSFAGDLDLPPRRKGSCDQEQAAGTLQQRVPSVVLQSGLGLLEFDTFLGGRHTTQLSKRQRRIEQPREEQDADRKRQKRDGGQHSKRGGRPLHPSCRLPDPREAAKCWGAQVLFMFSLPSEPCGWKLLGCGSSDSRGPERDDGWLLLELGHLLELVAGGDEAVIAQETPVTPRATGAASAAGGDAAGRLPSAPGRGGGSDEVAVSGTLTARVGKGPGSTADDSVLVLQPTATSRLASPTGAVVAPAGPPALGGSQQPAGPRQSERGGGAMVTVRRLTPTECERLQGFPDDWTAIDVAGRRLSDTARYRFMGNAATVPVVAWIAARLQAAHHASSAAPPAAPHHPPSRPSPWEEGSRG